MLFTKRTAIQFINIKHTAISASFQFRLIAYTSYWQLIRVKTTNMGNMFRLTYQLNLRDVNREKEMIDALRCRNGNLEISVSQQDTAAVEL